jgi:hypothetical protein
VAVVGRRPIAAAALEARERTVRIRAAARKGKNARQIAEAGDYPLKLVEQILAPIADVRLSDPAQLLNRRPAAPGAADDDVQVYWVGFLRAAGQICGQGASFALIVTLGDRSEDHVETLMTDLVPSQVRHEYCRSSLLGWQVYVRDPSLCKALLAWGIASELHGDDPTVLEDLPKEFLAPFLRGYLDGNWSAEAGRPRNGALVLHGTEPVLTTISAMVRRGLRVDGVVSARPPRAQLKFAADDARVVLDHLRGYTARSRGRSARHPA